MKLERIKKKIYASRDEARLDLVQYIEGYYTYQRRHKNNGDLPPKQFEDSYFRQLERIQRTGSVPVLSCISFD